ncbi:hypothetical protein ALC57_05888 [Trachymyrmex cornetzi]|uniref:Uncharacterized protein n=1 Tax=Trachymyrmex cornetzi TaxID=471704 RepID=A0A151J9P2_9HYME|nr:hypothetical protein ALC57_05888 [Trachymyrmex cornetzi]
MEYIMGHQRVVPQLVPCTITESIVKCNAKSMVDHLVNVDENVDDVEFQNIGNIEDMDGVEFDENIGNGEDMNDVVFENIRNMNAEQLNELFNEMDVDFENILDQESSDEESILSDDVGFTSDASEYETDIEEKFIPAAEIRALNDRTKYCMIHVSWNKQKFIHNEPVCSWLLFERQKVYTRLFNKYCENYDFENRYKTRSLTDNDFFCVSKIAMQTVYHCYRKITIPTGGEKIAILLIGGDANMPSYYSEEDPALKEKYFHDMCDDECFVCEPCCSALEKYYMARMYHAIIDMERWCNVCERVTCKCSVEECNVI